jgi:hypothetical protein
VPTVQRCRTRRFRHPSAGPVLAPSAHDAASRTGMWFRHALAQFTVRGIWAVAKLNGTFMLSAAALMITLPAALLTDTLN